MRRVTFSRRLRRLGLCLVWVLGLGISMADAVLPPKVYEQARELATYHVQVKVVRVAPPPTTPGECQLTGEVVRVFRDKSATLTMWTRLEFMVSCIRRGDTPLIGGTLWTDLGELMKARYLEVFLNQVDGKYEVALWQSRILEAPTDRPVIDSPSNP
jgi:hypothetical protein